MSVKSLDAGYNREYIEKYRICIEECKCRTEKRKEVALKKVEELKKVLIEYGASQYADKGLERMYITDGNIDEHNSILFIISSKLSSL